jgi:hypothetical protein
VPDVSMTAGKLDFSALGNADTWTVLITFLYIDFIDATATMLAMAGMIDEKTPGFLDARGSWPRQTLSFVVHGVAVVVGACLGTSPCIVFAESGVGIREGGRTGLTSLVVAFGFFISMFLAPIFASIPPYATGPAIFIIGSLMFENARHVDWQDVRSALPAFMTIILMPLTYSFAYGIIGGLFGQVLLWALSFAWEASDSILKRPGCLTLRQTWLKNTDVFYRIARMEQVLINELPGYVKSTTSRASMRRSGTLLSDVRDAEPFNENPAYVGNDLTRPSALTSPPPDADGSGEESSDDTKPDVNVTVKVTLGAKI